MSDIGASSVTLPLPFYSGLSYPTNGHPPHVKSRITNKRQDLEQKGSTQALPEGIQ